MALDFPPTPTVGYIYTYEGRSWQWNGTAWDVYSSGTSGNTGATGPQGNTGATGNNGTNGNTGPTGPQGNTGATGTNGTNGTNGNTGATGPQGNTGATGTNGTNGTNGNTGPTGPQGNTGNNGNTGATGQQGEPGQSSNYYSYKVHTTTLTPPTGNGEIRYNNASQTGSTLLYIDHLDSTGDDIDVFLSLLKQNDNLIIQDASDSNNYQTWRITSAPTVILNDYTTIPVTGITSAGTGASGFANNHSVLFIVFSSPIATQYVESLRGLTGAIGLTNGNGIDLSVSGNTLTFSNSGVLSFNGLTGTVLADAVPWSVITADQTAVINKGYFTNKSTLLTLTLPTTAAVGSVLRVSGMTASGWKIAQNASEVIHFGKTDTTVGVSGYIQSTLARDAVELICCVTDNEWNVLSSVGNITIV